MLLFATTSIIAQGKTSPSNFDQAAIYKSIASTNTGEINSALASLKEATLKEKEAYEGVLLMKKAGLAHNAKEKLANFKSGRTRLEAAIKNDAANVEYHFLRLIIQENAPNIVKYKNNLKTDAEVVRTSFKKLPPAVQQAVKDYSKKSKILNPGDF